jgi:hypothetical protein
MQMQMQTQDLFYLFILHKILFFVALFLFRGGHSHMGMVDHFPCQRMWPLKKKPKKKKVEEGVMYVRICGCREAHRCTSI